MHTNKVFALCLVFFLSAGALFSGETENITDKEALVALQKIVARHAPPSPEIAMQVRKLVFQLWDKDRFRHQATTLLNLYEGYGDRLFGQSFVLLSTATVDLPNFEKVDGKLFRGGQPSPEGFRKLKGMGVTSIVNLRLEDPSEEAIVKELGMDYRRIPLPDTVPPTKEQVAEFLDLMRSSKKDKVYVHCAAGKNRTGAMVAVWRMENGMNPSEALKEALRLGLHPHLMAADRIADFIRRYHPAKPLPGR